MANQEPRNQGFSPKAQNDTFEVAQGAEIYPVRPGDCVKQGQFAERRMDANCISGRVLDRAHPTRLQAGASVQNKANLQKRNEGKVLYLKGL